MMDDKPLVLTVKQAQQYLGGISKGLIYEAIRQGIIPSYRIGPRRIVIPFDALKRTLEQGNSTLNGRAE